MPALPTNEVPALPTNEVPAIGLNELPANDLPTAEIQPSSIPPIVAQDDAQPTMVPDAANSGVTVELPKPGVDVEPVEKVPAEAAPSLTTPKAPSDVANGNQRRVKQRQFGSPALREAVASIATNSYMLASEDWGEPQVAATLSQLGQFLKPSGSRIPRAIDVPVATLSLEGERAEEVLAGITEADGAVAQFFDPDLNSNAQAGSEKQNIVLFTGRAAASKTFELLGQKRGSNLLPAWVLKAKQQGERVVVILQGVSPE